MFRPLKPRALGPGSVVTLVSPASSAEARAIARGMRELQRLGWIPRRALRKERPEGYFAAPVRGRAAELIAALRHARTEAVICVRGGYGSSELLEILAHARGLRRKLLIGFSDITALQVFLWQRLGWVTLYGPMAAAHFDRGAGKRHGYDAASLLNAVTITRGGWRIPLHGRAFVRGTATGRVLGGCVTLLQTTLGTPWEFDARGAILLLEDLSVRPYQLDRMLLHLRQAGKFKGVRGIILGEFPNAEPARAGITIADVCRRRLADLGVPIVFGAPIGHTSRPMLTIPLGVRARLEASGEGRLDILEPAVAPRDAIKRARKQT
jgi:muramoyltetrapeptide carboxypeptidase